MNATQNAIARRIYTEANELIEALEQEHFAYISNPTYNRMSLSQMFVVSPELIEKGKTTVEAWIPLLKKHFHDDEDNAPYFGKRDFLNLEGYTNGIMDKMGEVWDHHFHYIRQSMKTWTDES